jgi:hypothetical protein
MSTYSSQLLYYFMFTIHPVSLLFYVYYPPCQFMDICIVFINNHTFSSIVTNSPEIWPLQGLIFNIYSKLVDCIKSLCSMQHVYLVKGRETYTRRERNVTIIFKIFRFSQIFFHLAHKSIEREVVSPCFYQVWWAPHTDQ